MANSLLGADLVRERNSMSSAQIDTQKLARRLEVAGLTPQQATRSAG
jgi:hypothetical protein